MPEPAYHTPPNRIIALPPPMLYLSIAPAGAPTVPRRAAAAEKALILAVQSGLLVSWTEAAELQRASLALCEACRRCVPVRVRVAANTPRTAWARGTEGGRVGGGGRDGGSSRDRIGRVSGTTKKGIRRRRQHQHQQPQSQPQPQKQTGKGESRGSRSVHGNGSGGGGTGARLPRLHISSLAWEAPASHLGDGSDLPPELRELTFGRDFNRTLSGLVWPPKLERLTFGSKFNRDLVQREGRSAVGRAPTGAVAGGGVVDREQQGGAVLIGLLPRSLEELTFGKQFNRPLPRRLLPPGLVSLTLGRNFRHRGSVRDVVWPAGIRVSA